MKYLVYLLTILFVSLGLNSCMWNDIRESREKLLEEGKKLEKKIAADKKKQQELTKIETIKLLYSDYVKRNESSDSEQNRALMKQCLESINLVNNRNELAILIDVWLYYDPAGFPTRELVFTILKETKEFSKEEVERKMSGLNMKEKEGKAAFRGLRSLLTQLK